MQSGPRYVFLNLSNEPIFDVVRSQRRSVWTSTECVLMLVREAGNEGFIL